MMHFSQVSYTCTYNILAFYFLLPSSATPGPSLREKGGDDGKSKQRTSFINARTASSVPCPFGLAASIPAPVTVPVAPPLCLPACVPAVPGRDAGVVG